MSHQVPKTLQATAASICMRNEKRNGSLTLAKGEGG